MFIIYKVSSGTTPGSDYTRISRYRDSETGDIWVLWSTDLTEDEVRADLDGDLYVVGSDSDADVLAAYPTIITQKRARIRAAGSTKLENVAGEYSAAERETWTEQKAQALAYLDSLDEDDAPMLNNYATTRGVDLAILAQSIVVASDAYQSACGVVLGAQGALLDQIIEATDIATALAVDWS
jgi:hypothetical protein